jgi:hypothetical protein
VCHCGPWSDENALGVKVIGREARRCLLAQEHDCEPGLPISSICPNPMRRSLLSSSFSISLALMRRHRTALTGSRSGSRFQSISPYYSCRCRPRCPAGGIACVAAREFRAKHAEDAKTSFRRIQARPKKLFRNKKSSSGRARAGTRSLRAWRPLRETFCFRIRVHPAGEARSSQLQL